MTIDTPSSRAISPSAGSRKTRPKVWPEELKASVEEGVATKTDLVELKAELYKAMSAQTVVLIGTMVGLKLFG